jgi:Cu/Ag efflux pump CusA
VASIQRVVDGYPGLFRDVQTYLKERIREVLTGSGDAIVVRIYGDDLDALREKALEVQAVLGEVDGVVEEHTDLQVDIPQIEVEVDLAAAQQYGLKPGDVRRAAATMVASTEVNDLWRGGKVFDVNIWSLPEDRDSVDSLASMPLGTPDGGSVRLDQIADVRVAPTPNLVERDGGSRRIDVGANVRDRDLGSVIEDVERGLASVEYPRGYHAELLGEHAERQAAQQRLFTLAGVAVLGVYLLLQLSFRSWRLATLSLLCLPVALVGGVLAAAMTGGVLSLGSLVGFFAVLGIAARNGILLISHCQHLEREEGVAFGPELVLRGARERLAPILMTTLATGLALVPLVVLGEIPGHEIEHPMAVVILGGLVTSTVLNLLVLPSLYLAVGRPRSAVEEPVAV